MLKIYREKQLSMKIQALLMIPNAVAITLRLKKNKFLI